MQTYQYLSSTKYLGISEQVLDKRSLLTLLFSYNQMDNINGKDSNFIPVHTLYQIIPTVETHYPKL